MKTLFIFSVLLLVCESSRVNSKGCALPVSTYDEKHMPVLVDSSYRLARPHLGSVNLTQGAEILLLCPSNKNSLKATNTNSTIATCVRDETVKVLKSNLNFENVTCTNTVKGTAISTSEECGNGQGYIIKIGFSLDPADFITLIEVCYDAVNGNALYASHTMIGQEIDYASKSNYRPSFSTAELGPGVSANVAYKQAYEKSTFSKILGSSKLAETYINQKSFLARGHLAADADFLFASWQYTTYFYVNTIPQWQQVNNGNWKRLEMLVRDTASYYGEDFQIYTGGYGVLQLPDVRYRKTNIYLVSVGNKLAVPKFSWKILYSQKSRKAIAFVQLNNPFVDKLDVSYMICTNVCSRYNWDRPTWNNGTRGFTYCCDARDFLGVVETAPQLKVSGIITGPKISNRFASYLYE